MARRGGRTTVRITGLSRLRVQLEDLEDDVLAALKKAVRDGAESVQGDTRQRVRVDTGTLRDDVAVRFEDSGLTALVGWFKDRDYYARFHEYGTRRMPASPALGPALEAERTRMRARITDEVRRVLR
ncbi:HK97-gp10 family putative phage morphogenesis protein [Streptomyces phytophilus]|uniref:HK97-gp10 family putative phage morphogenesis protein n=1 Tax=Streptomyces phytophilus TaxID=722715 RepID=UPI0015F095B3|nr:HK97-gp10 family putative phage morphogenesis protein [Streptomyces phytophilus]